MYAELEGLGFFAKTTLGSEGSQDVGFRSLCRSMS